MFRKAGLVAGFVSLIVPSSLALAQSADEKADEKKEEEPPPWAGSEITLQTNAGVTAFDRSANLTYNPVVTTSLSLDPRYKLNKSFSLWAHFAVETELTNSDVTSRKREPLLEDTFIQGSYALPKLPVGLAGGATLRLVLPTSKASLARETIFAIAPAATVNRSFKLSPKLTLQPFVVLRASFTLATARELTYDAPTIPWCSTLDNCDQVNHSPVRSSYMTLTEAIGVNLALPYKLSGVVSVWWIQSFLYDQTEIEGVPQSGPDTRYVNLYQIGLDWDPMKHVRVGVGLETMTEQLAPDSTYYTPFFNRWTQVYLKGSYVF